MPQAALKFTSREDGGALVIWDGEHALTRTYFGRGVATLKEDAGLPFREVLAKDLRDVRTLTGSKYNEGMLQLIDYYRTTFPELMAK